MTKENLVKLAYKAQKMAYVPYSGFQVGAALLTKSGKVYEGCNIENAAYTPCNCAERTAIFKAISEGVYDFEAIAIVGNKKGADPDELRFCAPCGVCRQVMVEFANPKEFKVYLGKGEEIREYTLEELLPESFSPRDLES